MENPSILWITKPGGIDPWECQQVIETCRSGGGVEYEIEKEEINIPSWTQKLAVNQFLVVQDRQEMFNS